MKIYTTLGVVKMFHQEASVETIKLTITWVIFNKKNHIVRYI